MERLAEAQVNDDWPAAEAPISGYLEVLHPSGRVTQRISLEKLPLEIGRAYSNDVIVEDPFVSPIHLQLTLGADGTLIATDLGSLNGLFREHSSRRERKLVVSDGMGMRIGHTIIRYRSHAFTVPEALADWSAWNGLRALENRNVATILATLASGAWLLDGRLTGWERYEAEELGYEFLIATGVLAICAGVWSLVGKLQTHRFNFSVHLGIVSTATILSFFCPTVLRFLGFGLDADAAAFWLSWFVGTGIMFAWFLAHLRYATSVSFKRIVWIAAVLALSLTAAFALDDIKDANGFSQHPPLDASLKPPMYKLIGGSSTEQFFGNLTHLRDRVDKATSREKAPVITHPYPIELDEP